MKIAQVVDKFLPVTESWIYSQITGLRKFGIKSEAFCHNIVCQDTHPFEPIHSYKDIPGWKTQYYRSLGKILNKDGATLFWNDSIKKGEFDLVHSHFGWAAQKGVDLAIKNNIPHIVTFYGADVSRDPFDPSKKEYQKKLPLIFDYSKSIICVSDFLKKRLIKLGAPKNKVIVWRPAVNVEVGKTPKLNDKIFRIISVGRFVDWKGQRYLIKALSKIIEQYPNVEINFIGTGPELENCIELSNKLNLTDKINFLGKLQKYSDVLDKMAESDIIVHSSYTASRGVNDSLGVVIIEAAMCNTPAVASNSGGIPEVIIDKKAGLLFEEKDYASLSEKIIHLIEDRELLNQLSKNAQKHCSDMFNYNNQINKLNNIICHATK